MWASGAWRVLFDHMHKWLSFLLCRWQYSENQIPSSIVHDLLADATNPRLLGICILRGREYLRQRSRANRGQHSACFALASALGEVRRELGYNSHAVVPHSTANIFEVTPPRVGKFFSWRITHRTSSGSRRKNVMHSIKSMSMKGHDERLEQEILILTLDYISTTCRHTACQRRELPLRRSSNSESITPHTVFIPHPPSVHPVKNLILCPPNPVAGQGKAQT